MSKKKTKVIQAAGGILWRYHKNREEIAIVHRHKHQDWSLPKGKLQKGETWKQAALREVQEETGFLGEIIDYAGSISYMCKGKPKVVMFWNMHIKEEHPESTNGEVDQLQWLPVHDALLILDYEDEKALLVKDVKIREKGT